ncbi:MAG: hypothetical protein ACK5R0_04265 [Bacteroidota bacterium]|jgi:O-antigen ligase
MKYLQLFLPFILYFLVLTLWEIYFQDRPDQTVATILKFGLLISYLRMGNSRTPLINMLTLTLSLVGIGEYLLQNNSTTLGQIISIISSIAFGLLFVIRQKLKDNKDKLSELKIAVVSIFVLITILPVGLNERMVLVTFGVFILTSVYFYGRLVLKP